MNKSPIGKFKVFRKSENTNSFGHHKLFVINDSNEVFTTHRSLSYPIAIGDKLVARNGLFTSCEMTEFWGVPPQGALKEIQSILN